MTEADLSAAARACGTAPASRNAVAKSRKYEARSCGEVIAVAAAYALAANARKS